MSPDQEIEYGLSQGIPELEEERRIALEEGRLIEPTRLEQRNGWTAETLTAYLTERAASQLNAADIHGRPQRRPNEANHRYRPQRWRG